MKVMVVEVNNAIGRDICTNADDVIVITGYSFMITDGSVVSILSVSAIYQDI